MANWTKCEYCGNSNRDAYKGHCPQCPSNQSVIDAERRVKQAEENLKQAKKQKEEADRQELIKRIKLKEEDCRLNFDKYQDKIFQEYNIPAQFWGAIGSMAYEDGHSYGYAEVLSCQRNICGELSDSIKNYYNAIKKEQH